MLTDAEYVCPRGLGVRSVYVYVLIDMQDMYILLMLSVWIQEFLTDIRVSSLMLSMRQYCSMS